MENCDFCKQLFPVYKCATCAVQYCGSCDENIHSKLKSATDHDISEVNGTNTEQETIQVKLADIKCPRHQEKACFMFCQNCDKSVCSSCLINSTQSKELVKIFEARRSSLENLKSKIEDALPFFEEQSVKFVDIDAKLQEEHRCILDKVEERKTQLIESIHGRAQYLNESLNTIWNPNNNDITSTKERIVTVCNELKRRREEIDSAFSNASTASVFESYERLDTNVPVQYVPDISLPEFHLVDSPDSCHIGFVRRLPFLSVLFTSEIDVPDVSAMCNEDTENIVLYSARTKTMNRFVISNGRLVLTRKYTLKVKGYISRYRDTHLREIHVFNNKLLIFDKDIDSSKILFDDGSTTNYLSDDYTPHCFTTHNASLFIGYTQNYCYTGVVIINSEQQEQRRFQFRHDIKEKLFKIPTKIAININSDIIIIDHQSERIEKRFMNNRANNYEYTHRIGRIVAVTFWGQPKWTYDGHLSINSETVFTPHDLVTTSLGYIIVADRDSSSLHVLSADGQFLTNIGNPDIFSLPVCLLINENSDQLLIGCSSEWDGGEHVLDSERSKTSKLHVAKLNFVNMPADDTGKDEESKEHQDESDELEEKSD